MDINLDRVHFAELDSPATFGDTLEERGFCARIHEQSIGIPVRRIAEKVGAQALPATELKPMEGLQALYSRFELWLIPHGFSMIRRHGQAEPTSVGLEVEYLNEGRTCSILALMPTYRKIVHGELRASLSLSGEVSAAGEAAVPSAVSYAHGGLTFSTNAGAGMAASVRVKVVTPFVSAVGSNSDSAEWRFDKHDHALFGQDLSVWTIIALPKRQRVLKWRARFYTTIRRFIVSTRHESDWTEAIECTLD